MPTRLRRAFALAALVLTLMPGCDPNPTAPTAPDKSTTGPSNSLGAGGASKKRAYSENLGKSVD